MGLVRAAVGLKRRLPAAAGRPSAAVRCLPNKQQQQPQPATDAFVLHPRLHLGCPGVHLAGGSHGGSRLTPGADGIVTSAIWPIAFGSVTAIKWFSHRKTVFFGPLVRVAMYIETIKKGPLRGFNIVVDVSKSNTLLLASNRVLRYLYFT